jgi:hypothetical protein
MLLVIISLATATIITTAYLASRDNSGVIGENVNSATTARWAALSGVEVAVAVLETETAWRDGHVDGVLIDDYVLGRATLHVTVEDLETGQPPTADTCHVRVSARASVDGVAQTASATAFVGSAPGGSRLVALDLAEFAVFTRDEMLLRDAATVTRWPVAPASVLGRRLAIGTRAIDAGAVQLSGTAAIIDATIYYGAEASPGLVLNFSGPPIAEHEFADRIPMPAASLPSGDLPGAGASDVEPLVTSGAAVLHDDTRYERIELLTSGGVLWATGDIGILSDGDMSFMPGSSMVVNGNVTLIVSGDLVMREHTYIELLPDASLTIHVGGDLDLRDAYIGDARVDHDERDASGGAAWMDPRRVVIHDIVPGGGSWRLHDNSVLKGSIYAPGAALEIRNDSAVYGRIAVGDAELRENAAVFYDHALDTGAGYTSPDSLVFDTDGNIDGQILGLPTFGETLLEKLAELLDVAVMSNGSTYGTVEEPGVVVPVPGEVTPRPVPVEYDILAFGADLLEWETRHARTEQEQADGSANVDEPPL